MSEERDEGVSLSPLGEQADASDNDICSGESGTARRPKRRALAGRVTPQRDRRSAGFVIGEAMSKLVELEIAKTQNSNQVPLTQDDRVANAIDILMKNYQYLDSDDLATIADVFGNGCNATIFAKLTGAARDAWISKKLM
uniref:Uncharacterized protein n=1 Tax=Spongospora subterranea TaxID=70186 RepID=A0A0H5QW50_9EUKA|eukprot:CRZ05836.1 hypothetical protein [Spongospora subterranea]